MKTPKPPEKKEVAGEEFSAVHVSRNSMGAGKNYRLFLGFLEKFISSGAPAGTLKFTCPEVQKLEAEIAALREDLRVAREALDKAVSAMKAYKSAINIAEKRGKLFEISGVSLGYALKKDMELDKALARLTPTCPHEEK